MNSCFEKMQKVIKKVTKTKPTKPKAKAVITQPKAKVTETQPKAKAVPWFLDGKGLVVLSLNMEYYHKYNAAKDKAAYEKELKDKIPDVDVLCVQEDLLIWSDRFLEKDKPFHDFERIVSSMTVPDIKQNHSMLKEMVYEDNGTMKKMAENGMKEDDFSSILGNSIYLRKSTEWKLIDQKAVQISTNQTLPNGKPLGYRSAVCATLSHENTEKPVQVLCTHLSGGRFEDAYMSNDLKSERANQMDKCLKLKDDLFDNVLMGDFNASTTRTKALAGYLDVLRKSQPNLSSSDYYSYMMAPFTTCAASPHWNLLYKDLDGPTTAFGHVVDYFLTSPHMHVETPFQKPPKVERIRMVKDYMPFVKPTASQDFYPDVLNESITDHNAVKVSFFQPTNYINSATITFTAVESSGWSKKMKELEGKMPVGTDSSPKVLLYPITDYTFLEDGPKLNEQVSMVDLINKELKPLVTTFMNKSTPAAFEIFMKDCAAKEREILIKNGWHVEEKWYSINKSKESFTFTEKMIVAHKSLHGSLLNVRVLQELLKANMLKRE